MSSYNTSINELKSMITAQNAQFTSRFDAQQSQFDAKFDAQQSRLSILEANMQAINVRVMAKKVEMQIIKESEIQYYAPLEQF